MPLESVYRTSRIDNKNVTTFTKERGWQHSPRRNGKLLLENLPYAYTQREIFHFSDPDNVGIPTALPGGPHGLISAATREAETQSYSRLRGRLYQGGAALGVTAVTYKQSREMIVKRYETLGTQVTELYAKAHRSRAAGRDTAGLVLEGLFGWQPLIADVYAAATSVIHHAPTGGYVSATGRGHYTEHFRTPNPEHYLQVSTVQNGNITHKRTASYTVSNRNLWLAERAGLLNPVAVAWDLIPHSYIINMFTNTAAIVNSITDFTGLSFTGGTVTVKHRRDYTTVYVWQGVNRSWTGSMNGFEKTHSRTVGNAVSPPSLRLEFRLPNVDWSLAAIAASVATQKVSRLLQAFPINRRQYTE